MKNRDVFLPEIINKRNSSEIESEIYSKNMSDVSIESIENLTDYSSETGSIKFKKNIVFDTKFPKYSRTSKKNYSFSFSDVNVVNEEKDEDEDETIFHKLHNKKLKKYDLDDCFYRDDIDVKNCRTKKKSNIHKSFMENSMETLYEVKEDQNPEITISKKDRKIKLPNKNDEIDEQGFYQGNYGSSAFSNFKFEFDQNEVITEDNNENNFDLLETKKLQRSKSNKLIEGFIDKSEGFVDDCVKRNTENIIETIKEENVEEEDEITANLHQSFKEFQISDEIGDPFRKIFHRISVNTGSLENDKINELEDEM